MSWNALAPWYRWLEYAAFGRGLQRRRLAYLPQMADARSALVLRDGDGRFLAALVEANSQVVIDYVDGSEGMRKLAARRNGGCERVRFHVADARTWDGAADRFDLVVSHFFLDCFSTADADAIIGRVGARMTPDARWIVSEFRAAVSVTTLYFLSGLLTELDTRKLPKYENAFARHGFTLSEQQTAAGGLLCSQVWVRR